MPNEIAVTPDEVRGAIGTDVTAAQLPDGIIRLQAYEGIAIREVKGRDSGYAARAGDEAQALNNAANFITAALLVVAYPSILAIKNESGPGFNFQRTDPFEYAAYLRGRAEDELSEVIEVDEESLTSTMPTMFTVAEGRRGA